MSPLPHRLVRDLRAASRELVREFGFLNRTIAGSDLSASAVHALIEIGASGRLTASDLSDRLLLEKSTISRLVNSLKQRGEIDSKPTPHDNRSRYLRLTGQGERTLSAINGFAESQVVTALKSLDLDHRATVLEGLRSYAAALRTSRVGITETHPGATIHEGYVPGLVGRLVTLHADYYSRLVDFGAAFETAVAGGLSKFIPRLDNPANRIWRAEHNGEIVGGISIDGQSLGENRALLRWFVIGEGMRGAGLGYGLIGKALNFCDDRGFDETQLLTFQGLHAARHLYDRHGFELVEAYPTNRWGPEVLEQKFIRTRPKA